MMQLSMDGVQRQTQVPQMDCEVACAAVTKTVLLLSIERLAPSGGFENPRLSDMSLTLCTVLPLLQATVASHQHTVAPAARPHSEPAPARQHHLQARPSPLPHLPSPLPAPPLALPQ
jgi:hypothetical protein